MEVGEQDGLRAGRPLAAVQAVPDRCPKPLSIQVPGFATIMIHIWDLLT